MPIARKFRYKTAGYGERHHMSWYLALASREALRGVIRGSTTREQGLIPGPVRTRVRRRRLRLLGAYARRFGEDAFYRQRNQPRAGVLPRSTWLGRAFATWRLGRS